MTESEFASLAHPFHDPTVRRNLLSRLAVEDVQVRVSGFLRQFGDDIRASSSGLVELLSSWAKAPASYEEVCGLPIGIKSFREPPVGSVWAAAASALHLNAAGRGGAWEASFDRPVSLRWGPFVTPALRGLEVSECGAASRLHLLLADGGKSSVYLDPQVPMQAPKGWRELDQVEVLDRRFIILDSESPSFFPIPMLGPTHSNEPACRIAGILRNAVLLIHKYAAEYTSWVEDAVWALIPVLPPERGYQSGSLMGLYGIIYESFPVSPLDAAEGLIHEASHQYYHLAQFETLFANGEDTQPYWSPYPKKERSIDRILIAFHAFANVTLFYRACLAGGTSSETERAKMEISFHLGNLRLMSEALERSAGLTSDGRALFQALRERLFE